MRRDLLARRKEARCPMCEEQVTLVLDHATPHVRHLSNSKCVSVTQPESALHYNLKHHLRDELQALAGPRSTLWVEAECAGRLDFAPGTGLTRRQCPRKAAVTIAWLKGWDEVLVEEDLHQMGLHRKPDVVLRRAGVVIGGVEVRYSSKVTAEKASDLEVMGVPWVEVKATEELLDENSAWAARQPLPVLKVRPEHDQACAACARANARAQQCQQLFGQLRDIQGELDHWNKRGKRLEELQHEIATLQREALRWMIELHQTLQDVYVHPDQVYSALLDDPRAAAEAVLKEPERVGELKLTRKYLLFSTDQPARALLPACADMLEAILVAQWDLQERLDAHNLASVTDLPGQISDHRAEGEALKQRRQIAHKAYMDLVLRRF